MMFWHSEISAEAGPHKVLLKKGVWVDESRFNEDGSVREVPYKIYYPDAPRERFPVIIWSHGFGGSRDGAAFLARYVASYGYVIVHLTHVGTDTSLWEGKGGHPWDILRETKVSRAVTLNRFRDVPFALDQLDSLDLPVDLSRIGMSGHSFGAITTQVMAGQLMDGGNDEWVSLHEPRFRCGIVYSPVPSLQAGAHAGIQTPLFHMTGTEDEGPINGKAYAHRLAVYEETPAGVPKSLLVKRGGDHMVYNGTRGKLAASDLRERHEEIIKLASLAWWEAWLKDDGAARGWLEGGGFSAYLGEDGTFQAG